MDSAFREPNEIGESAVQAARLLFILPSTTIDPVNHHGVWFIDSVRFLMIVVVLVAVWHFVHPVILKTAVHRSEHDQIRLLLEKYATTGLAYFHLLDDKLRYLADDGHSFLTYRLVGSTAIALGEPIGDDESCRTVARSFVQYCELNGWSFAFHQVSGPGAELLGSVGLRKVKIGEEAIVPVQSFALEGSHFKRTRTKNRQLLKEGVVIEELVQPIDAHTMTELRDVSDVWLADGDHRERAFTVGAFEPQYLRDTIVFVARSARGRIEAFVNVLPSYSSGIGNFDLMRRRPDAPNGVMDLMLVHLIDRFRKEGLSGMTLGFAPLANIEGAGVVARTLRAIYERESAAFNFKGLFEFKDKWRPIWEPRYLVYRSDVQLPMIALAVARVGERREHAPILLRLGWRASR
jgi:phosphatidylglycerol lysyltransferase